MRCNVEFNIVELKIKNIKAAFPEIMIPLVSTEIKIMKNLVNVAKKFKKKIKLK